MAGSSRTESNGAIWRGVKTPRFSGRPTTLNLPRAVMQDRLPAAAWKDTLGHRRLSAPNGTGSRLGTLPGPKSPTPSRSQARPAGTLRAYKERGGEGAHGRCRRLANTTMSVGTAPTCRHPRSRRSHRRSRQRRRSSHAYRPGRSSPCRGESSWCPGSSLRSCYARPAS